MARADADACDPCAKNRHGQCDDPSCGCCGARVGVKPDNESSPDAR
jgi:hypothetical protein